MAIDTRGFIVRFCDQLIIRMFIREVPFLDLIDGNPADSNRSGLAEYRDRTFEVLGIGAHRGGHRAEGS